MTDTTKSLLDQVLTSNPAAAPRKPTPPGSYSMVVREVKAARNPNNGNEGFEIISGLIDATGGQDVEGVDLSRAQAYYTLWITEGTISAGIAERVLTELGAFQEGETPRAMLEAAVGNTYDGAVELRAKDVEAGRAFPRLDVTRIGTFQNSRKAA